MPGQVHVEEDERRLLAHRRLDAGQPVLGVDDRVALGLEDGPDQHAVLGVVLDVEDLGLLAVAAEDRCGHGWSSYACGRAERQGEVKRRALALAALRPDPASVQLDELLADGQPEPGAVGLLGERIVEPLEGLEQSLQIVGAMPIPVSATDTCTQLGLGRTWTSTRPAWVNLMALDSEVEQHLLDPRAVGLRPEAGSSGTSFSIFTRLSRTSGIDDSMHSSTTSCRSIFSWPHLELARPRCGRSRGCC